MPTLKVRSEKPQINQRIAAVAYYRMSSDRQDKSIEEQRYEVTAWAAANNYTIIGEYADEGISGDKTSKRKQFQRMMADAETGAFDAILCWDQDRFGRFDSTESGYWTFPLREAGIHLATVAQGVIDWNSFSGRVIYTINQEGKNQFLKDLSRNITRGFLEKARKGLWVGGTPPLGFIVDPETEKLARGDESEILLVLKIFTLYDSGMSLTALTDELNRSTRHPRTNNKWCRSSVRLILFSPYYTGDFIWPLRSRGRHFCVRDGQVSNKLGGVGSQIILPENHEALISKDLFDRVQSKLKSNRTATTPIKNGGNLLFSGLVFCEKCGCRMHGRNGKNRTGGVESYYQCSGPLLYGKSHCSRYLIRQDELLEHVTHALQGWARSPETRKRVESELRGLVRNVTGRASATTLKQKICQLENEIEIATRNILMLSNAAAIPIAEKQLSDLIELKRQAEIDLKATKTPPDAVRANMEKRINESLGLIDDLGEILKDSEPFEARTVLRKLVERIDVTVEKRPSKTGKRMRYQFASGWVSVIDPLQVGDALL